MLDRAGGLAAKRHEGARIDRNAAGLERLGQLAMTSNPSPIVAPVTSM